jgi:hypothetical protein
MTATSRHGKGILAPMIRQVFPFIRMPMLGLLLLGLLALGCGGGSTAQRCSPQTDRGCEVDETCTVDATGTPICVARGAGLAGEGSGCVPWCVDDDEEQGDDCMPQPQGTGSASELQSCADGLGCVSLYGVSRCLRFCDPSLTLSIDACHDPERYVVEPSPDHQVSACQGVLAGRTDIGVCTLPCRLYSGEDECPTGSSCGLPVGAPHAVCRPYGDRTEGVGCGVSCACEAGLICSSYLNGAVCRVPTSSNGSCPASSTPALISGVVDPLGGVEDHAPYRICTPCLETGRQDASGVALTACVDSTACAADGSPASLEGLDIPSIALAALGRIPDSVVFISVGVELRDGEGWVWTASGNAVANELWADGTSPASGQCAVLGADGLLRAADDCDTWQLCGSADVGSCSVGGG